MSAAGAAAQAPAQADWLVLHGQLLTMRGAGVGFVPDGAVAVRGERIADVGPSAELAARYPGAQRLDASGCAVLPGLIDVHAHSPFALLRGVAQDVSHWMQRALAPFARHLDEAAMRAGTRLALLEALQAGTTTLVDFARPYPGWAECFAEAGLRSCLTPTINALPAEGMAGLPLGELYPLDAAAGDASIRTALDFADRWHGAAGGRIRAMLGPQAADMLGREQLLAVRAEALRRGLLVHMHVAQGDRELAQLEQRYGARTPQFLAELGYLDEHLLAVHLTEASDAETELIARSGARMALCSGSIGIIDGIVPPAQRFRAAGGPVGLGTDQAAGNNQHNLFNEMKLTALFNKIRARDPQVMPAWEVLRMATIEGARAIGLDAQIGSLEVGKQADLILVDLAAANLQPWLGEPIRTLVPNLVYAATGKEVRSAMIAGRLALREREPTGFKAEEVLRDAQREARRVCERVAADPLSAELSLLGAMHAGQL